LLPDAVLIGAAIRDLLRPEIEPRLIGKPREKVEVMLAYKELCRVVGIRGGAGSN